MHHKTVTGEHKATVFQNASAGMTVLSTNCVAREGNDLTLSRRVQRAGTRALIRGLLRAAPSPRTLGSSTNLMLRSRVRQPTLKKPRPKAGNAAAAARIHALRPNRSAASHNRCRAAVAPQMRHQAPSTQWPAAKVHTGSKSTLEKRRPRSTHGG